MARWFPGAAVTDDRVPVPPGHSLSFSHGHAGQRPEAQVPLVGSAGVRAGPCPSLSALACELVVAEGDGEPVDARGMFSSPRI